MGTSDLFGFRFGSEWTAAEQAGESAKAIAIRFVCEDRKSKAHWFPKSAVTETTENGVRTMVVATWFAKREWHKIIFDLQKVAH